MNDCDFLLGFLNEFLRCCGHDKAVGVSVLIVAIMDFYIQTGKPCFSEDAVPHVDTQRGAVLALLFLA